MEDIKAYWRTWLWRDAVTKVITINFLIWLALACAWLFLSRHQGAWLSMFAMPGIFSLLPSRVWTVVTFMFTQVDFLHLLVNMLWLMLFGRILMDLQGGQRMIILYVYGGLAAALTFLVFNSVTHTYNYLIGSSCSVLAIVGAVAVLYPHFQVNLLIFGQVKLLWLAVAAAILFAVQSTGAPQMAAHGAGLMMGIIYALSKKRGIDITSPIYALIERLSARRVRTARPVRRADTGGFSRSEEAEMDRLLAKVSQSGYSSLSTAERQRLFDLSQRSKRR